MEKYSGTNGFPIPSSGPRYTCPCGQVTLIPSSIADIARGDSLWTGGASKFEEWTGDLDACETTLQLRDCSSKLSISSQIVAGVFARLRPTARRIPGNLFGILCGVSQAVFARARWFLMSMTTRTRNVFHLSELSSIKDCDSIGRVTRMLNTANRK